jgi:hypothetical protein
MWRTCFSLLLASVCALPLPRANAQEFETVACHDNSYSDQLRPGEVSITEIAITYAYSNCPVRRLPVTKPIGLTLGRRLYFWMRLQGDDAYLKSDQSAARIDIKFARHNEGIPVVYDAIGLGNINRSAASSETALTGGRFDWRLAAWKATFESPGRYQISFSQDGQDICISDSRFASCIVEIEIQ